MEVLIRRGTYRNELTKNQVITDIKEIQYTYWWLCFYKVLHQDSQEQSHLHEALCALTPETQ